MATVTVLNDLHLKPAYDDVVAEMSLPSATDLLVVAGDLIDDPDRASVRFGRRVLERFDRSPVPTVVVPGNHDPRATSEQLVAGFETVHLAYQRRLTTGTLWNDPPPGDDIAIVGWGCAQFDVGRELPYETADAFGIYDEHGHVDAYRDAMAVETLLKGIDDLIAGRRTPAELCEAIGLDPQYREPLDELRQAAQSLLGLLAVETDTETLLVSHVPPFGTTLDVHHSAETRTKDGLHTGWLALSGAIRRADPTTGVFGHSHIQGYDSFETVDTHLLNGGFRGVTTIETGASGFSFSFRTAEWLPG